MAAGSPEFNWVPANMPDGLAWVASGYRLYDVAEP